jgi:hypothetical protein
MTEDAPAVARLRQTGAVLLGKTTTPEFGWKGVTDPGEMDEVHHSVGRLVRATCHRDGYTSQPNAGAAHRRELAEAIKDHVVYRVAILVERLPNLVNRHALDQQFSVGVAELRSLAGVEAHTEPPAGWPREYRSIWQA